MCVFMCGVVGACGCVCICVYLFVQMCALMFMCVYVGLCVYLRVFQYLCVYMHVCVYGRGRCGGWRWLVCVYSLSVYMFVCGRGIMGVGVGIG